MDQEARQGFMVAFGAGSARERTPPVDAKDDLDRLVDELAADDPAVPLRVTTALRRREFARELTDRRQRGLTLDDGSQHTRQLDDDLCPLPPPLRSECPDERPA